MSATRAKPKKPGRKPRAKQASREKADDAERFTSDVLSRGEAARTSGRGELPPGATHEIVGVDERGRPKLRRRRFSAV